MGEEIKITAITYLLDQDGTISLQIDFWFDDQQKGGRMFIDQTEFFKLLSEATTEKNF